MAPIVIETPYIIIILDLDLEYLYSYTGSTSPIPPSTSPTPPPTSPTTLSPVGPSTPIILSLPLLKAASYSRT